MPAAEEPTAAYEDGAPTAPVRSSGQLLVRVHAAALDHPDLLMTRGAYPLKPPLPLTPGMEMAGEAADAHAVPPPLDFAAAASVDTACLSAHVALVRLGAVRRGEWVLIHGATGGVGFAAVDLAKVLGARVIATWRTADNPAIVADGYAPDATLPAPGFREQVMTLAGGRRRRVRREHALHRVRWAPTHRGDGRGITGVASGGLPG